MSPVLPKVIEIAADEFRTNAADLTGLSSPEDVEDWDSESQLRLVMATEEYFGVSLDIEDFVAITSLQSLADIVTRKKSAE